MSADLRPQTEASTAAPVLEISGLSKTFPGTKALSDVSLRIHRAEIHALVGQNGSGKSTLIKVLSGFHRPDPGARASFDGRRFDLEDADRAGDALRFVHQELGLILELGAADNLALLGGFQRRGGNGPRGHSLDWPAQRRATEESLARFGVEIDVDAPLHQATPVERTVVAISAALQHWEGGAGVLVLDEPTAVLPHHEVDRLHEIVHEVRRQGTSVLYVSHRLDELFGLADRVTVLRGGEVVARRSIDEVDKSQLASLIVGRRVDIGYRSAHQATADGVACELRGLRTRELRGVGLQLRRGEILGVAGLPGSGIRDLPYAVAGALARCEGEIRVPEAGPEWLPIARAAELNVPLVPADRATEAVVEQLSVKENLTLGVLDAMRSGAGLSARTEDEIYERWAATMEIKAASGDAPITTLSGGNQQKVVMARCLAREPRIMAMCEPTAGVDAGTRQALHAFAAQEAGRGLSIVVSSTDLDDLLAMCNRVVVLARGEIVASLARSELSEEILIEAMEGS